MMRRKIVENICSNWASLMVNVMISFLVSPMIVHSLGNEQYGIWILITSLTGYFTVLDFGVNTAIVRYISSNHAQNEPVQVRKIYSTSIAIFAVVALVLLVLSCIFGLFFQSFFGINHVPRLHLYLIFMLSAVDLACGLLFSVFLGSLSGLQEFKFINGSFIIVTFVKSVVLVYLLKQGHGLITLALLQVGSTFIRALCQYWRIKARYPHIFFRRDFVTKDIFKLIYRYSAYSFIIAIALKLLFYTDSLVIGAKTGLAEVTFYAIPATLIDYLEKFVWAMITVLVPIISANEATGKDGKNVNLYVVGTRISLLFSMPFVISLYFYGHDFIRLWMGQEISDRSFWVLRLLLIGFGLAMSQLIAHGILKGISKHKVLAIILSIEALANLGMSVVLAKPFGIEGVAFGTMVPLLAASLVIILYTCRLLRLGLREYLLRAYSGAAAGLLAVLMMKRWFVIEPNGYLGIFLNSGLVTIAFLSVALPCYFYKDAALWFLQMRKARYLKLNQSKDPV
jgi:O-antigen/teichoic acid export membrane protein